MPGITETSIYHRETHSTFILFFPLIATDTRLPAYLSLANNLARKHLAQFHKSKLSISRRRPGSLVQQTISR